MFKFWMDPKPNSFSWKEKARGEGARRPSLSAVARLTGSSERASPRSHAVDSPSLRARSRGRPPTHPAPLPTPRAIAQSSRAPESSRPDTCTAAPPSGCVPRPRPARRRTPAATLSRHRSRAFRRSRSRAAANGCERRSTFPARPKIPRDSTDEALFLFFSPFPDSPRERERPGVLPVGAADPDPFPPRPRDSSRAPHPPPPLLPPPPRS